MRKEAVTPKMLELMSPTDRARYSVEPLATPSKQSTGKLERQEHKLFRNWLVLHNYSFRHTRTDKRTTEEVGTPDFSVYAKRETPNNILRDTTPAILIEFKLPGNKQSPAQQLWASNCGGKIHVLYTAAEAIELIKTHFCE